MVDKSLDLFRKYMMNIPPGKVEDTIRLDSLLSGLLGPARSPRNRGYASLEAS